MTQPRHRAPAAAPPAAIPVEKPAMIDSRLPLPWLISSAATIILAMGGVFMKLDTVSTSLAKLEAKVDKRDDAVESIRMLVVQGAGKNDLQQAQIERTRSDLIELKANVEAIKLNAQTPNRR